jgi:hypothetical protein
MKREEIEKASKKYANENAYIPSDGYAENNMIEMKESFAEAFKDGVEWRINSVWHSGNEVPKKHEDLVIELDTGFHICQFKDGYSFLGYYNDREFIAFEVIRWAYLKDLLPNMED